MSQKCGQFAETLISGYLDGVLGPSDRRWVKLHLLRCAVCRHLLEDLREIRNTMMTTCWHNLPEDLVVRTGL